MVSLSGQLHRANVGWAPTDRLSAVLAAMAEIDGDRPSALDRLCGAAVGLLSLRGAGISLMADEDWQLAIVPGR